MLVFKKLTIKNFMSIGEQPQTIDFDSAGLTLILGENQDMVSEGQSIARNGAGKSAIFNALSFALFGQALSAIKRDNLINNINSKNMFVVFEFSKDGHNYRIERGRRPNFFKFMVDDSIVNSPDTDEAQGESRLTQTELEKVIGMSHNLFKHIIALNTITDPFLKLGAKQQREFIEELLGMRLLSEKAEALKELLRLTKEEVKMEEFKVKTLQESNKKIEKNIEDMKRKRDSWDNEQQRKIRDLQGSLNELSHVNIDQEIENHKKLQQFKETQYQIDKLTSIKTSLQRDEKNNDRDITATTRNMDKTAKDLESALEHNCPTCGQEIHDDKHENIVNELALLIESDTARLEKLETEKNNIKTRLQENENELGLITGTYKDLGIKPEIFYDTVDEAYNHRKDLDLISQELKNAQEQTNPYNEQIESLEKTGLQEVNFETINDLVKMRDHQEFLLKLLTSNDSFIRKKIIDQNIAFLNDRLSKYLEKLGLPHSVTFKSDLTVAITNFGHELDFENLSRGERTRLILGLCWSFRDIYELMVHPVNVILIDELLDIGSDNQLVESAMAIIKKMNQTTSKSVFIISHKDELVSKIPQVLKVVKENGFSSFELDTDYAP